MKSLELLKCCKHYFFLELLFYHLFSTLTPHTIFILFSNRLNPFEVSSESSDEEIKKSPKVEVATVSEVINKYNAETKKYEFKLELLERMFT